MSYRSPPNPGRLPPPMPQESVHRMFSTCPRMSRTRVTTASVLFLIIFLGLRLVSCGYGMGSNMISPAPTPTPMPTGTGMDVTTYHNDNSRSGQNLSETTLTTSNVNSTSFGKLFAFAADGKVNAEPLYLSNVTIGGAAHNVLYVVSEHGTVYAADADTGTSLWQVSTLQSGETTSDDHGCGQISPEIGITATP